MGLTQTANTSQASKVVCQFIAALLFLHSHHEDGLLCQLPVTSYQLPVASYQLPVHGSVSVFVSLLFRVSKSAALQPHRSLHAQHAQNAVCALAQELICVSASQKFMNDSLKPVPIPTSTIKSESKYRYRYSNIYTYAHIDICRNSATI